MFRLYAVYLTENKHLRDISIIYCHYFYRISACLSEVMVNTAEDSKEGQEEGRLKMIIWNRG